VLLGPPRTPLDPIAATWPLKAMMPLLFFALPFIGTLCILLYVFWEGGFYLLLALAVSIIIIVIEYVTGGGSYPLLAAFFIAPFCALSYFSRKGNFSQLLELALSIIIIAIPPIWFSKKEISPLLPAILISALLSVPLYVFWQRSFLLLLALALSFIFVTLPLLGEFVPILLWSATFIAPFCGLLYVVRTGRTRGWWRGFAQIGSVVLLGLILVVVEVLLSGFLWGSVTTGISFIVPFYGFLYLFRKGDERKWWPGITGFSWLVVLSFGLFVAELMVYGINVIPLFVRWPY
jgi:hypothetical protein